MAPADLQTILKGKNGKSAGLFNDYADVDAVLANGWTLVNTNNYELGLVELNENCVAEHIKIPNKKEPTNDDVIMNKVPKDIVPPDCSIPAGGNRRILADKPVKKGKAITLKKKPYEEIKNLPFDDGLLFKFPKSKPEHI